MSKIEDILSDKGEELKQLKAPDDLEMRMGSALEKCKTSSKRKEAKKLLVAAALIVCLFVGYNIDALAFYAKQLVGYEPVMNGTLQRLNELGKGQVIGEKQTLKNGVSVILDGAMLDENQLILFYTIKSPAGDVDKVDIGPVCEVKGVFDRYYMQSAMGNMSTDKKEAKYIAEFEIPRFFDNRLEFKFTVTKDKVSESGEIPFKLDLNKAMGHTLKKSINQNVKVGSTEIYFDSILATPTRTTIKGSLRSGLGLAMDELLGERFRPGSIGMELVANGNPVPAQSWGMSTDMKGITFHNESDALPSGLNKLQIHVTSYSADHDINRTIGIQKGAVKQTLDISGQELQINDVRESKGETLVTITTAEDTILTKVSLAVDGKSIKLKNTDTDKYDKYANGKVIHTRTLHFPAVGNRLELDIRRMTYTEACNATIDIPVD